MNSSQQVILATLLAITIISLVAQPRVHQYWRKETLSKGGMAPAVRHNHEGCLPDQYIVQLREAYSYESHKGAVASAVDLDVSIYANFILDSGRFVYAAYLKETALTAVKADGGVWLIECDATGEPDQEELR